MWTIMHRTDPAAAWMAAAVRANGYHGTAARPCNKAAAVTHTLDNSGPGEKLEEQRDRLQQEQRKLHDQQEALAEKLAVLNSRITSGIVSQRAEGVGNS